MSDDFSEGVKRVLAARVGNTCSNPACHALTSGPQEDPAKAVNLGVAAHITAASPGGPRYDPSLVPEERSSPENGIWLCQNCAKLIDNDPLKHTTELLLDWKRNAEQAARQRVGKTAASNSPIVDLDTRRKPFTDDLERCVNQMLDQMTYQGHLLMRHLLIHEPIELGRPFIDETETTRLTQMEIAMKSGVVRHSQERKGAMTWTYYVVSERFRPILEAALYSRLDTTPTKT